MRTLFNIGIVAIVLTANMVQAQGLKKLQGLIPPRTEKIENVQIQELEIYKLKNLSDKIWVIERDLKNQNNISFVIPQNQIELLKVKQNEIREKERKIES